MNLDSPETSDDRLRAAVTHEVRSQLTPILLQVGQHTEDIRQMKWTIYGNAEAGQEGLVTVMKSIQSALTKLIDGQDQRTWMQRGLVVGVGIQLLSTTGFLSWIEHLIKSVP